MSWKYISTTVAGKSHLDRNEDGQDYNLARVVQLSDKEYFIGLAADGAGSTTDGGTGATLACETIFSFMLETIRHSENISLITENDVKSWIISSRNAIEDRALKNGKSLKDYACTILGSLMSDTGAIFFQIGDGGIVINTGAIYQPIFWPEQGEYLNTTFFISDTSFLDHIRINKSESVPDQLAIFTDGIQNLVLSFSDKTAHIGFFKPLFEFLWKHPNNEFFRLSD